MINLLLLPIDATSGGANIVVPGQAGKVISVVQYTLSASANTTVQWLSNTTPLSGPMTLVPGIVCNATGPSSYQSLNGVLQTDPGEDLVLNLSAPSVGGHLTYRISLS